jgi:hypothetical protein
VDEDLSGSSSHYMEIQSYSSCGTAFNALKPSEVKLNGQNMGIHDYLHKGDALNMYEAEGPGTSVREAQKAATGATSCRTMPRALGAAVGVMVGLEVGAPAHLVAAMDNGRRNP